MANSGCFSATKLVSISSPCHHDPAYIDWVLAFCASQTRAKGCTHKGADFVDVSLGIIVQNAADSITAFHPHHHHGTTKCGHVRTTGIAFTFSQHILKAYRESLVEGRPSPYPVFTWEKIEVDEDVGSHLNSEEGDDYSCTFSQEVINPCDIIACADTPSE